MTISLTQLRTDLYKIVDQVIETGIPVEIEQRGQNKLTNLTPHPGTIIGDPKIGKNSNLDDVFRYPYYPLAI